MKEDTFDFGIFENKYDELKYEYDEAKYEYDLSICRWRMIFGFG
jgi:hypothetical protein